MKHEPAELHALVHASLDGRASVEEAARLNTLLRTDAAARDVYLQLADLHCCLAVDETLWTGKSKAVADFVQPQASARSRWLSWRPLAAAAAGLVFGMFCTSVLFAYVHPRWEWEPPIPLLRESFESGEAPLVTGVPTAPDRWSGDFTEVVGQEQGVQPADGKKMLRFLRGDYDGKPNPQSSRIADLYRLIDVRPYRQKFSDGAAVVQFSASFNAFPFAEGSTYLCKMSLHAYDAQTVAAGPLDVDDMREGSDLALARTGHMILDRDPSTWQRVAGDLRLPANTDFLMVHLSVQPQRGTRTQPTFGGHYLDDVRLTLTRRPTPQ